LSGFEGRWGEVLYTGLPQDTVEAFITVHQPPFLHARLQQPSPALPLEASHFEDVDEIRFAFEGYRQLYRDHAIIPNAHALITDTFPQKLRAQEVECAARHRHNAVLIDIRVGKVDREQRVVVPHRRTQ